MRGLPVLGLLVIAVMMCNGCSSAKRTDLPDAAAPVHATSANSRQTEVPSGYPNRRVSPINVPPGAGDAEITEDIPASEASSSVLIARRIDEVHAEWRDWRERHSTGADDSKVTETSLDQEFRTERVIQPDPALLIEIERKYAPRFLNCRLRIMAIRGRLAAEPSQQTALQRQMDRANAELVAVDEEYRQEIKAAIGASAE
jgi:hypothetical protein